MKLTIKKEDKILRVPEAEAHTKVKMEGFSYCPKSEWKKATRPAKPQIKQDEESQKLIRNGPEMDVAGLLKEILDQMW